MHISKHIASLVSALALFAAGAAERISFSSRPMSAGRASLTEDGFRVPRNLGTANATPELAYPIELTYESFAEKTGIFGFAWHSPQLESSAAWDKDGVLWTTPWGERIKFRSKREKVPKDAVKIALHEEAKKGRGYFAPYSDWEADTAAKRPEASGDWTFAGKRGMAGWTFTYRGGRLFRIDAPSGRALDFAYDKASRPVSVSQDGTAFVTLSYNADGLAERVTVNGVETRLAYRSGNLSILPKTLDGQIVSATRPRLVSIATADLYPETYGYAGNYLSEIRRGGHVEKLTVQTETLLERRRNLRAADPKSKADHTGKIAGRLLSDGDFTYSYGEKTGTVALTDRAKRTARYAFNEKTGVFDITEFSGRKYTIYYFMRYDVAYLGKVRKVVDGRGRDIIDYRYDRTTGRPMRIRDRLGNDVNLEWDADGHLARRTRRISGSAAVEPVRGYTCDKAGNPVSVSELDADGKAVRTATAAYDREGRPVRLSDGRHETKIAYTKFGRPASVTDTFGRTTTFAYDSWNRPVSVTDADGIMTTCAYTPAGQVAKIERRAGDELVQSVAVEYDRAGQPLSYTDQDGRKMQFERDAFGRVVKEIFPDSTEVGYAYDEAGRLASVTDENRNEIKFGWDAFGLASRTTAANQLTDYVKDQFGLLKSAVSSQDGRTDRTVTRTYDAFDRVTKIVYGKGEVETFAYDAYGRLAKHTRGKKAETYSYDYFGRLAERCEDGVSTAYAYDAYGQRTRRTMKDTQGEPFSEETRSYDRYGRLVEIVQDGKSVKYEYNKANRLERQTIDGKVVEFGYTKFGRLQSKTLLSGKGKVTELKYWYGKDGKIVARLANGQMQKYAYDLKGQLTAVTDADGKDVERYAYDPAGNILEKMVGGRKTTYAYDAANQLVSSTDADGKVTEYAYDAAGRLVKEGAKTYRYGYLDKVLSVTEGKTRYTYDYHVDGQLATATKTMLGKKGGSQSPATETFLWDGLALVKRGGTSYVNEPHPGGGAAVLSSKDGVMFNDILGTTLGVEGGSGYTSTSLTAFGDDPTQPLPPAPHPSSPYPPPLCTGKPHVDGLGHAFLFRNYRAGLGKWLTADPLGYPDGWNQLAYCGNGVSMFVDLYGTVQKPVITSLYDALNWYATGNGAEATVGDNIMNKATSTDAYNVAVINTTVGELSNVPISQNSGTFEIDGNFQWDEGLVLGRNTMNYFVDVSWTASAWRTLWNGIYYRTVTGDVTVTLTTMDRWDFETHNSDSIWATLIREKGPEAVATLYSLIVSHNTGKAFDLTGMIELHLVLHVQQYLWE